jgi:hypothetical protein
MNLQFARRGGAIAGLSVTANQSIRGGAERDGGPKSEVAQDLVNHRRLPDKKTVKHRVAVLE